MELVGTQFGGLVCGFNLLIVLRQDKSLGSGAPIDMAMRINDTSDKARRQSAFRSSEHAVNKLLVAMPRGAAQLGIPQKKPQNRRGVR
jgi:hypothetical protein